MTTFTQHSHPGKLHSASAYTERRELLTVNATPARLEIGLNSDTCTQYLRFDLEQARALVSELALAIAAMDAQQTPHGQPGTADGG